jgi:hypothetical protein
MAAGSPLIRVVSLTLRAAQNYLTIKIPQRFRSVPRRFKRFVFSIHTGNDKFTRYGLNGLRQLNIVADIDQTDPIRIIAHYY